MNIAGIRIIATYTCSKNCKFCYQSRKSSIFLTPKNLLLVLNKFKEKPEYITLMGGELSEFPNETDKLLTILSKKFNNISLTTNGSGNYEWYKSLYNKGIKNISFSIPSINCKSVIDKMLKLKKYGHVRANCFFDRTGNNVSNVLLMCRQNKFALTLCEDILKNELHIKDLLNGLNIDNDILQIIDETQRAIIKLKDGYEFYIYRHINNYNNDNLIILPNGSITYDFNDVLKGIGYV